MSDPNSAAGGDRGGTKSKGLLASFPLPQPQFRKKYPSALLPSSALRSLDAHVSSSRWKIISHVVNTLPVLPPPSSHSSRKSASPPPPEWNERWRARRKRIRD